MAKRILILHGHPDTGRGHLNHALAGAYREGAGGAGHEVREIHVAELDFPLLSSADAHKNGAPPEAIRQCQEDFEWAEHVAVFFPLWLGGMPAILKGFLEQLLRPGFAYTETTNKFPEMLLKGRSARIVVTMGMPGLVYRWYFGAHSVRNLERNILRFCGFRPVRVTLIGLVDSASKKKHEKRLERMRSLGRRAI